jgi:PAS domain-containing protein
VASSPHSRVRSARGNSFWASGLRYVLALGGIALAAGIVHALQSLGVPDPRPVFLIAIAIATLYEGLGPGLVALLVTALIVPDLVLGSAGAVLVAICAAYRHARHAAGPVTAGLTPATSSRIPEQDPPPPAFAEHKEAPTQSFTEVTTEASWRFQHERPLDITLPEDEQVEHLYLYSVLAECNDAFARMYGFRSAAEVIGTRLVVFLPPSNPENVAYLRSFIRRGYRLEEAESHEIDRYGNSKYFINNLVGIFERGELVGAWGTQRDVTESRSAGAQEYRSRLHSTKSSSQ